MALVLTVLLLLPFRIDSGPYAGAFRLDADGAVNWYFATTALLRLPVLPVAQTRAYLDAYLAHLDPNGGIADVLPMPTGIFAPIAPDSEDAYASTFLSLAARYREVAHDDAWWRGHASALASVAYAKLLTQFKADGLIRASRTDPTGYLMDNVEDEVGLRDYAAALHATHDPQERYVNAFVAPLRMTIARMFDEGAHAYRWSDSDPIGPLVPYPACVAQLFPQLGGITSGDATHDRHTFAAARARAARCAFSIERTPHEALLYATFIAMMHRPSLAEQTFARRARLAHIAPRDLVTVSLQASLDNGHPAHE